MVTVCRFPLDGGTGHHKRLLERDLSIFHPRSQFAVFDHGTSPVQPQGATSTDGDNSAEMQPRVSAAFWPANRSDHSSVHVPKHAWWAREVHADSKVSCQSVPFKYLIDIFRHPINEAFKNLLLPDKEDTARFCPKRRDDLAAARYVEADLGQVVTLHNARSLPAASLP